MKPGSVVTAAGFASVDFFASENGAIASASFMIGAGSCSVTEVTVPASTGATPPLAAVSWAVKKLSVPDPLCGISGLMTPAVPPTWFQLVTVPL